MRAALLAAGAGIGLLAALAGALGAGLPQGVPADALATVGERPITREDYARALSALEADKRNPLTDADRAMALRRLVEEEALVQRGIALGIAADDPAVRKAIVQAMVQFAAAQDRAPPPSEDALRAFYADRPALFAAAPQMRVHALALPASDAAAIAQVRDGLATGATLKATAAAMNRPLAPAPDRLLGPADVRTFLGPGVAQAAFALQAGQSVGPIPAGSAAVFVQAIERVDAAPPPFEIVRGAVEAEWRRQREDGALDRYLEDLRRSSAVRFADDAPR